jgi:hypothetical protein
MAVEETISLTEQCRQIVEKLHHSTTLHARDVQKEVDQIERDLARLRDRLIDRLRAAQMVSVSARREGGLDAVNSALSLVVAVEYPFTSIQRSALKQAGDTLKKDFLEAAPGAELQQPMK